MFDDEFYTVPFMREGTILPNWTDLVQRISQIYAPENIDLKGTWLTPDIEEYHIKPQATRRSLPQIIIITRLRLRSPYRM